MAGNVDRKLRLPRIHFRVLLHAANILHGTNGFTSLPKEGVLRIFSPWKIQWLWPGLNTQTWVPKASTLPLDDRSRFISLYTGLHVAGNRKRQVLLGYVRWLCYINVGKLCHVVTLRQVCNVSGSHIPLLPLERRRFGHFFFEISWPHTPKHTVASQYVRIFTSF